MGMSDEPFAVNLFEAISDPHGVIHFLSSLHGSGNMMDTENVSDAPCRCWKRLAADARALASMSLTWCFVRRPGTRWGEAPDWPYA
jgi:hypothetical protein